MQTVQLRAGIGPAHDTLFAVFSSPPHARTCLTRLQALSKLVGDNQSTVHRHKKKLQ